MGRIGAKRTGPDRAAIVAADSKRAGVAVDLDHFETIARAERPVEHRVHVVVHARCYALVARSARGMLKEVTVVYQLDSFHLF